MVCYDLAEEIKFTHEAIDMAADVRLPTITKEWTGDAPEPMDTIIWLEQTSMNHAISFQRQSHYASSGTNCILGHTNCQDCCTLWKEDSTRSTKLARNASTFIANIFKPRRSKTTIRGYKPIPDPERELYSSQTQTTIESEPKRCCAIFSLRSGVDYFPKLKLQSLRHMCHGMLQRYIRKATSMSRPSHSCQSPKPEPSEKLPPSSRFSLMHSSGSWVTLYSSESVEDESRASTPELHLEEKSWRYYTNTPFRQPSQSPRRSNSQLNEGNKGLAEIKKLKPREDCMLAWNGILHNDSTTMSQIQGREDIIGAPEQVIEDAMEFYQADLEQRYQINTENTELKPLEDEQQSHSLRESCLLGEMLPQCPMEIGKDPPSAYVINDTVPKDLHSSDPYSDGSPMFSTAPRIHTFEVQDTELCPYDLELEGTHFSSSQRSRGRLLRVCNLGPSRTASMTSHKGTSPTPKKSTHNVPSTKIRTDGRPRSRVQVDSVLAEIPSQGPVDELPTIKATDPMCNDMVRLRHSVRSMLHGLQITDGCPPAYSACKPMQSITDTKPITKETHQHQTLAPIDLRSSDTSSQRSIGELHITKENELACNNVVHRPKPKYRPTSDMILTSIASDLFFDRNTSTSSISEMTSCSSLPALSQCASPSSVSSSSAPPWSPSPASPLPASRSSGLIWSRSPLSRSPLSAPPLSTSPLDVISSEVDKYNPRSSSNSSAYLSSSNDTLDQTDTKKDEKAGSKGKSASYEQGYKLKADKQGSEETAIRARLLLRTLLESIGGILKRPKRRPVVDYRSAETFLNPFLTKEYEQTCDTTNAIFAQVFDTKWGQEYRQAKTNYAKTNYAAVVLAMKETEMLRGIVQRQGEELATLKAELPPPYIH